MNRIVQNKTQGKYMSKIIYTKVDEAPALASYSLLPIIKKFTKSSNIEMISKDISLASRIIANFPDNLKAEQKIEDHLKQLGELTQDPNVNIIKIAKYFSFYSTIKAVIAELQAKDYDIPNYDASKEITKRYSKITGSAVNPVLREGNSDRRAPSAVKNFARNNPHKMGVWKKDSKTDVLHMNADDFYGAELSKTFNESDDLQISFVGANKTEILKDSTPVLAGEIIDATCMSASALQEFYAQAIQKAKKQNVLLSLHLKATMIESIRSYYVWLCC